VAAALDAAERKLEVWAVVQQNRMGPRAAITQAQKRFRQVQSVERPPSYASGVHAVSASIRLHLGNPSLEAQDHHAV
jgi:hypothetical protein